MRGGGQRPRRVEQTLASRKQLLNLGLHLIHHEMNRNIYEYVVKTTHNGTLGVVRSAFRKQYICRDGIVEYPGHLARGVFPPLREICLGDSYLRLDASGGDHHVVLTGVRGEAQGVDHAETFFAHVVCSCVVRNPEYKEDGR